MDFPLIVSDPVAFERELAENRRAYEGLKERLRRDYKGQYVAIAHGRLVATAATFDEATEAVARLQPRPQHFAVFEAEGDPMFEPFEDLHGGYFTEFPWGDG
jgi:hypothetical protein